MVYDFMRIILFFDLPMVTKTDRKVYNKFRKWLIQNGYLMMQYSIYCKIFANREAVNLHVSKLNKNVPSRGQIRIMTVTEKQYANILLIIGEVSTQETVTNTESLVVL